MVDVLLCLCLGNHQCLGIQLSSKQNPKGRLLAIEAIVNELDEDEDTRAENKQKDILARRVYFWRYVTFIEPPLVQLIPIPQLVLSSIAWAKRRALHVFYRKYHYGE